MGTIFLVVGPAGVGKSTAVATVLERNPDIAMPRGVWTRPPRPGVAEDSDTIDPDALLRLRHAGLLTACNEYAGHLYGTPLAHFTRPLDAGRDVLRIVTMAGVDAVRRDLGRYPIVAIFLWADLDTLARRLAARGDDLPSRQRRLVAARGELATVQQVYQTVVDEDEAAPPSQQLLLRPLRHPETGDPYWDAVVNAKRLPSEVALQLEWAILRTRLAARLVPA